MTTTLIIMTLLFIVVSVALVLIVLVQRPQGGGLAGAFGGAGGGGTDTAFGGRTGDVLTIATVSAFLVYLLLGVALNIIDNEDFGGEQANEAQAAVEGDGEVLEQDTPGEFLVPETAPEVPAPTPTEAAPAAAAPAPAAPAATDATTAPANAPSGDG